MARERQHRHHKSRRSKEHHKSRKTKYVLESPIFPEPVKVSKSKRPTHDEGKTSQPQKFMLDDAQIQMLAEQIAQLQATSKNREAASHAKVSSVREHVDQATAVSKPKKTVSIAGIFHKSNHRAKETKKKSKSPPPEEGLLRDFHDGLEHAYTSIQCATTTSFDEIHAGFQECIQRARKDDAGFIAAVTKVTETLSAPFMDEVVQVERMKNGKCTNTTATIGHQIAGFKALLDRESARLEELWREWEGVRGEYEALEMDVFGGAQARDGSGGAEGAERKRRGSRMSKADAEHDAAVVALDGEIEELCARSLEVMENKERELDRAAKKEQELLLRQCLFS